MSGPTNEPNQRIELTAYPEKKRIYIFTVKANSWGPNFVEDIKEIKDAIERDGLTRPDAKKLRDSKQKTSMAQK